MTEYRISIVYTVGENFIIKADSLAVAEQRAMQLAEDRMEAHGCSEIDYEIMGTDVGNGEHVEGRIYG